MRILIVHEAVTGGGGVESYLTELIPALRARGHHVAFLHHNSRSETGDIRLEFPGVPSASVADDGLEPALASVRRWSPDVCFSHNMRYLGVEERLMSEWPVIKMMHGFFGTCLGGHKAVTFPSVEPCTRLCGPACLPVYLPRHCGQLRPLVMVEKYRWHSHQRSLFPQYAGIVVTSDYMRDEYARYDVGANLLTTAPLFPAAGRSHGGRPLTEEPTVLFLGRMVNLKGGDVLIRENCHQSSVDSGQSTADCRLPTPPIHLIFAGEGPERQPWLQLASELGVKATWIGWVSGEDRIRAFRRASVLAVPSLFPEPFGLVGLEAAAHGVPAIAFDIGGIRHWLHDDVNGRLVTPRGSVQALGAALGELLRGPAELQRLGIGALRTAARFSIDAHLDILERVFAGARAHRASLA
jgi:glycosyltransferase involved in cell wall biosynthesis